MNKIESITSRERVLAALKHIETDRIPIGRIRINSPAIVKLAQYLKVSVQKIQKYLFDFSDTLYTEPDFIGPKDRKIIKPDKTRVDIWGVERKPIIYGEGSYDEISYYPLADIHDTHGLDNYIWPTEEWISAASIKDKIKHLNRANERAIIVGNGNIFETSWYMRGFEQMLADLLAEPELAWEIMTRVTDFYMAYFRKILESADGMVDIVFTADDIGQQQGLLLSPTLWEKMIKPHHVRLNKAIHEYGVKIMYHSDGAIMEAVPGLVDMGIDILEALQFDAKGMDPEKLKEYYGDVLCFQGGISVQSILPFGSIEDVKNEVTKKMKILGKNGGYILAPSHNIQAGTPPENIVAFLEAARGKFFVV